MDHSEYKEALDAYKQERLPVVLTAAEAMDVLGVGKNTMYRLLKSGNCRLFGLEGVGELV